MASMQNNQSIIGGILLTLLLLVIGGLGYRYRLNPLQKDPTEVASGEGGLTQADPSLFSGEIQSSPSPEKPLPVEEGVFFSPYVNKRYLDWSIVLIGGIGLSYFFDGYNVRAKGSKESPQLAFSLEEIFYNVPLRFVRFLGSWFAGLLLSWIVQRSILNIKKQQSQVFWEDDHGQLVQRNVVYWPLEQGLLVLYEIFKHQVLMRIFGKKLKRKRYTWHLSSHLFAGFCYVLLCFAVAWYLRNSARCPKLQGGRYTAACVGIESLAHLLACFVFDKPSFPPSSFGNIIFQLIGVSLGVRYLGGTWLGYEQRLFLRYCFVYRKVHLVKNKSSLVLFCPDKKKYFILDISSLIIPRAICYVVACGDDVIEKELVNLVAYLPLWAIFVLLDIESHAIESCDGSGDYLSKTGMKDFTDCLFTEDYSIPMLLIACFWYPLKKYAMGVRR